MEEWEASSDDDDFVPPLPAKRKGTSSNKGSSKRFAVPTSVADLEKKSEGVIPKNTQKNDQWALKVFTEWIEERNQHSLDTGECPKDILETEDGNCLSKWLSLFTVEVRRKDGGKYPPTTIHMLLCSLQRIMRRKSRHPFNIFDKKDVRFRGFHGTMETVFQSLHKEGVGTEVKHTPAISDEEEADLWRKKILGDHSPLALVRAVFYQNGKNFCLRGGQEHRQLKFSQLTREKTHWKYVENGSKNFRGGVSDLRRENKVVQQFPCASAGTKCHAYLLDLYVSKLPEEAKQKGAFYFTPLKNIPTDAAKPWFTLIPIGWNKLDRYVREMFEEAGIHGKTNHCLRVTGATRMYRSGIPEKTIQSRTGHKSVDALRVYERPGQEQQQMACNALTDVSNCQSLSSNLGAGKPQSARPWFNLPMTPSVPPTFTFSGCSVNVFTAPIMNQGPFQAHSSENFGLSESEVDDFSKF